MTVPIEATPEMVKAALDLVWEESETHDDLVCRLWRAMAAVAPDQTAAARDVQAERRRQIDEENFRAADDDNYVNGSLAAAASCYAMAAARKNCLGWEPVGWPWHYSWWKPAAARRDLVKAGALILAEIERLDRLPTPPNSEVA